MLKTTLLSTILALSLTMGSVAHAEEAVMTGPDGTAITQAELDEMGANITRIQRAVMIGDVNTVKEIIGKGMNPNLTLPNKDTLLTFAYRSDAWAVVKVLLENELVDVNHANAFGETPLMLAVFKNRPDDVEELLKRGANVNMEKGWTPLHYAATEGNVALLERLIKAGADVNAQTSAGVTPLMMAARKPSRAAVKVLLKAGAYRDYCTDSENSAANFAEKAGDEELAKFLKIERCAVIGPKNPALYGRTTNFADFVKQSGQQQ